MISRFATSRRLVLISLLLAGLLWAPAAQAAVGARLKDIARIREVRSNQLYGVGLVVGLAGSGDSGKLATQLVNNMLQKLHVTVPVADLDAENVAAVMVTAEVPPFLAEGSRLDVLISSIGDAESLQGGTLLQTPLQGADDVVYAVAQGPLSTGGFSVSGEAAQVTKNHPTVARIPGGAVMERRILTRLRPSDDLHLVLNAPDYTTSVRAADAINAAFADAAISVDAAIIRVRVPFEYRSAEKLAVFVARLDELKVVPDTRARVVVNERTGTIVAGEHVKLSTVAVSHGSLTISVRESTETSQPGPFSSGTTTTEESTDISAVEEKAALYVVHDAATLADVARALNLLGVSPRDMVSIFQALKAAGALQAELIII